jgi:molybdopterin-guanine dinucleotide biosynthesis protein A
MWSRMFDVEGFILVGGQSSRMGSDKSQLVFGERTGVERIAAALGPLTTRVRLVGSRVQAEAARLETIPDTHERWGALGGIHAALVACGSEWAVIAACDLPLVSTELFSRLWQLTRPTALAGIDATVPIQPDERPQPLCAIYRRDSCVEAARELIAEGEHKPRALLAQVRTRWVEFRELADLPGSEHFFLNVNTPDNYEQAKKVLASLQKRTP